MPTKRTRSTQPGRMPLSPAMSAQLQLGHVPPDTPGRGARFFWGHEVEPAWREFREPILEAWIAARAGTRPWAWWRYDAPAPRACVEGVEHVYRGSAPGEGDWIWKQELGLPGRPQSRVPGGAPATMAFEAQATYLRRLDLLRPDEAARLTAADFAPEIVPIPAAPRLAPRAPRPPTASALASSNGAPRRLS